MTERGERGLVTEESHISIGPSSLEWNNDALLARINERAMPLPRRVRGVVRINPVALAQSEFALDPDASHLWRPIAPRARIEVCLDQPGLSWQGTGYLDSNRGSEPLERAFRGWEWSRSALPDGRVAILYDVAHRIERQAPLSLLIGRDGEIEPIDGLGHTVLPSTRWWRIDRSTRADHGFEPHVVTTLEDTPFYARSLLRSRLLGMRVESLHESLSLDRFRQPWVRALLPFRMPRAG